jgi:hypothetical protein
MPQPSQDSLAGPLLRPVWAFFFSCEIELAVPVELEGERPLFFLPSRLPLAPAAGRMPLVPGACGSTSLVSSIMWVPIAQDPLHCCRGDHDQHGTSPCFAASLAAIADEAQLSRKLVEPHHHGQVGVQVARAVVRPHKLHDSAGGWGASGSLTSIGIGAVLLMFGPNPSASISALMRSCWTAVRHLTVLYLMCEYPRSGSTVSICRSRMAASNGPTMVFLNSAPEAHLMSNALSL